VTALKDSLKELLAYVKLAEVTQSLFRSYPRLLHERIAGHGDIASGRKTDPGPPFGLGIARFYKVLATRHFMSFKQFHLP
jgi:N-acetyl-anhydromuramyl-L-alanine amidase AmpD